MDSASRDGFDLLAKPVAAGAPGGKHMPHRPARFRADKPSNPAMSIPLHFNGYQLI
jgi:hypothetical protein